MRTTRTYFWHIVKIGNPLDRCDYEVVSTGSNLARRTRRAVMAEYTKAGYVISALRSR